MSSYNRMTQKLERLLEDEHVFMCHDLTCDIKATFEHGCTLWAMHTYHNCGAASDEFSATYGKLIEQYGKRFMAAAERERVRFCAEVESITCDDCNAITWVPDMYTRAEYNNTPCDNCARPLKVSA